MNKISAFPPIVRFTAAALLLSALLPGFVSRAPMAHALQVIAPPVAKPANEAPSQSNQADIQRITSNESAAVGNLRTIVGAQTAFYAAEGCYATLGMLAGKTYPADPPFLDKDGSLVEGQAAGYRFILLPEGTRFSCTAVPLEPGVTGNLSFFTDESGVIRYANALETANRDSKPVGS